MDGGARRATYSPCSSKELDTTEHTYTHSYLHINIRTGSLSRRLPNTLFYTHCNVVWALCTASWLCSVKAIQLSQQEDPFSWCRSHFLDLLFRILCSTYLIFQNFRYKRSLFYYLLIFLLVLCFQIFLPALPSCNYLCPQGGGWGHRWEWDHWRERTLARTPGSLGHAHWWRRKSPTTEMGRNSGEQCHGMGSATETRGEHFRR